MARDNALQSTVRLVNNSAIHKARRLKGLKSNRNVLQVQDRRLQLVFAVEWRDALRPVGRVFVFANMASRKVCCLLGNPSKLCVTRAPVLTVAVRGNASYEPVDKVTHTGQKFDANDRRLARFVDKQKEVNNNWAIKLIEEVPPKPTKDRIIACDGGGGPLGHPKVYINLDRPGNHSCGYCGLRFYKEDHHHH